MCKKNWNLSHLSMLLAGGRWISPPPPYHSRNGSVVGNRVNISFWTINIFLTKFCWTSKFWTEIFFFPKLPMTKKFGTLFFFIYLIFRSKSILDQKIFVWPKDSFLEQKFALTKKICLTDKRKYKNSITRISSPKVSLFLKSNS